MVRRLVFIIRRHFGLGLRDQVNGGILVNFDDVVESTTWGSR